MSKREGTPAGAGKGLEGIEDDDADGLAVDRAGEPLAARLRPAIDEERVAQVWQRLRLAQAGRARTHGSPDRLLNRSGFWAGHWSRRLLLLPATAAAVMIAVAWLVWPRLGGAPDGEGRAGGLMGTLMAGPTSGPGIDPTSGPTQDPRLDPTSGGATGGSELDFGRDSGRALTAREPSISLVAGAELAAAAAPRQLALRDGSQLSLGVGARLQVFANDGHRFGALLDGVSTSHFEVREGQRRWTIETELATLEGSDTRFTVAADHHQVRVTVERGQLMVRGERVPGRVMRLTAGNALVVIARLPAAASRQAPASSPAPRMASSAAVPADATSLAKPAASTAPAQAATVPVAAALRDADRLRRGGDARAAAELLEATLRSQPTDAAAGLIEFTLGRLYLERLGDPARAAAAFAAVSARGTPHSLLEDAMARRCEALWRAGLAAAARQGFAEYQRHYPRGARVAALEALLSAP